MKEPGIKCTSSSLKYSQRSLALLRWRLLQKNCDQFPPLRPKRTAVTRAASSHLEETGSQHGSVYDRLRRSTGCHPHLKVTNDRMSAVLLQTNTKFVCSARPGLGKSRPRSGHLEVARIGRSPWSKTRSIGSSDIRGRIWRWYAMSGGYSG